VHNTGYEIHLDGRAPIPGYSKNTRDGLGGFSDPAGLPFALILPEDWLIPIEFIDLGEAYPQLLAFVSSSGSNNSDWYRNLKAIAVKPVTPDHWKW
jgi:LruC domain-containing protein